MSAVADHTDNAGRVTPLHALHVARGAKMTCFAGYDMPLHFSGGIVDEHLNTRESASLFDVSHMGQAMLAGASYSSVAAALETLTPGDIAPLAPGRLRYAVLTNDGGGAIDDVIVTRPDDGARQGVLLLVVNAARKEIDYKHFADRLPNDIEIVPLPDRALIALQGPASAAVLSRHCPGVSNLRFMACATSRFGEAECRIARCGYAGEDGFEISMPAAHAEAVAEALLAEAEVQPAGLGARDMLRLEAGLCLYGHELDETISPVQAGLEWSIPARRRNSGGFLGAERILRELREGPASRRVGLKPNGRSIARDGAGIFDMDGRPIGLVTSGGYGATAGGPIAMGYVRPEAAAAGTPVVLIVRGRPFDAEVVPLPFVPHRTAR